MPNIPEFFSNIDFENVGESTNYDDMYGRYELILQNGIRSNIESFRKAEILDDIRAEERKKDPVSFLFIIALNIEMARHLNKVYSESALPDNIKKEFYLLQRTFLEFPSRGGITYQQLVTNPILHSYDLLELLYDLQCNANDIVLENNKVSKENIYDNEAYESIVTRMAAFAQFFNSESKYKTFINQLGNYLPLMVFLFTKSEEATYLLTETQYGNHQKQRKEVHNQASELQKKVEKFQQKLIDILTDPTHNDYTQYEALLIKFIDSPIPTKTILTILGINTTTDYIEMYRRFYILSEQHSSNVLYTLLLEALHEELSSVSEAPIATVEEVESIFTPESFSLVEGYETEKDVKKILETMRTLPSKTRDKVFTLTTENVPEFVSHSSDVRVSIELKTETQIALAFHTHSKINVVFDLKKQVVDWSLLEPLPYDSYYAALFIKTLVHGIDTVLSQKLYEPKQVFTVFTQKPTPADKTATLYTNQELRKVVTPKKGAKTVTNITPEIVPAKNISGIEKQKQRKISIDTHFLQTLPRNTPYLDVAERSIELCVIRKGKGMVPIKYGRYQGMFRLYAGKYWRIIIEHTEGSKYRVVDYVIRSDDTYKEL